MRIMVAGDRTVNASCHRVIQGILELPETLGEDIYEYVCQDNDAFNVVHTQPQRVIQKPGCQLKLKMEAYNHTIPQGKSYTPFFNTLGTIIVFRFDDKQSFMDVINWLQEAKRYSNLQAMHFFIVGCNYRETTPVITDKEASEMAQHIISTEEAMYVKCDGTEWDTLRDRFGDFMQRIYDMEFPPSFLFV